MVSSSVMIFVTLAGSIRACSSLAYRIVPVSFSISIADGAVTSTAPALAVRSITALKNAITFFIVCPLFYAVLSYVDLWTFMTG